jgi:acetone carboxylase gamma subunit
MKLSSCALLAVATACGSPPAAEHPAVTSGVSNKPFKAMTLDERVEFMKQRVLPETKRLFVAFDPSFASMTCKTCHGDGAEDGSWDMPNPKIIALPGSEAAFMAWVQAKPEMGKWAGFMASQLEPAMGKLLQIEVFDPATKTGAFSCEACHVLAKP